MIGAILGALALGAAAWAAGRWVVPARRAGELRAGHAGLSLLAGLCLLAALLACGGALGASRTALSALPYLLGAAGLAATWRRRPAGDAPEPGATRELAALAPLVVFGHVGILVAISGPPVDHDAVAIWLPKMHEAADAFPVAEREARAGFPFHAHPQYPRGLAWLAAATSPLATPDARSIRLVPLLFVAGASLTIAWAMDRRGNLLGGVLAASIVLATPQFSRVASAGLADAPVGAAALLAGVALALAREGATTPTLAATAGAAAGSIKAEGFVLTLAMIALLGATLALRRARARELAPAALLLALPLPWWLFRAEDPNDGPLALLPLFLADPAFLVERLAKTPKALLLLLVDPGSIPENGIPGSAPASVAAWAALASLAILAPAVPRGRAPLGAVVWPAVVMLAAEYAVYVATPSPLGWHVSTSADRLLAQALPLLVLGATARLTSRPAPAG